MELALYCPDYGYYEKEKDTVGARGDFYTSVSVGNLFGELLAFQFANWLEELQEQPTRGAERATEDARPQLVEAGAHTGQLAHDILSWLQTHRADIFEKLEYCILEPSPRRRQWQEQTLQKFSNVRWLNFPLKSREPSLSLPWIEGGAKGKEEHRIQARKAQSSETSSTQPSFCGIFFSNELLDAMPVYRIGWDSRKRQWFEWGVTLERNRFTWTRLTESRCTSQITHSLPDELLAILPNDFTTEISPAAESWWQNAAHSLRCGKLVAIDYGLTAEEFFVPERKDGTLRAYHRHHLNPDVLANPGEQDITAHVNFTAVKHMGEAAGLKTESFTTQPKFLMQIIAAASDRQSPRAGLFDWTPARVRQIQTLTHPEHLGRAFRVLVQSH